MQSKLTSSKLLLMIFAVYNLINLNVLLNIVRFFVPIYLSGLAFAYKKCEIQFAINFFFVIE